MKSIYVGNLSYTSTPEELGTLFGQFGTVTSVRIVKDRETGRSRGFAFVEMSDDAAADTAVESLNGQDFGGRNLKINEAKERTERKPGGFGGGHGGGGRSGGFGGGHGGGGRSGGFGGGGNRDFRRPQRFEE